MCKIGIIGHFGADKNFSDGQTVKTRVLHEYLSKDCMFETNILDTYNITHNILKLVNDVRRILKNNDIIILIVSSRGYKVLLPIIMVLNILYKKDIFDFVIGGFRQNYLAKNRILCYFAKKCKKIYVESKRLVKEYQTLGFTNCEYLPNFKKLEIVSLNMEKIDKKPYKVCTFSRIRKEKGIEDAINAVIKANESLGEVVYTLTIYGIPDKDYVLRFEQLKSNFPHYIEYGGLVDYTKTTEILKNYFLLLFPSYHNGEGFPGTMIDAFASGLPMIVTDWNCNSEIIEEGRTGSIVAVRDVNSLADALIYYANNPEMIIKMRENCLQEATKYLPQNALSNFVELLKGY